MGDRFLRIGIEIPLSLYSNLDKIKNGSAASGRILEAVKKEKKYLDNSKFAHLDTYEDSVYDDRYSKNYDIKKSIKNFVYGVMEGNDNRRCDNCMYYRSIYGYGQCYAQKNAPRINDNYSCENFRPKEEDNNG